MAGASSLGLVREELETTIQHAESCLEQFIEARNEGSHIQQCVNLITQIRGTLSLIEMSAGEMLADEMLEVATDIPEGAGAEHDEALGVLSNSLFVLNRYIEYLQMSNEEIPELLIPTINELRKVHGESLIKECFFYSIRASLPDGDDVGQLLTDTATAKRLRLMYQVGLLGFIRDANPLSGAQLMSRSLHRLHGFMEPGSGASYLKVAGATLEVIIDAEMSINAPRKSLFGAVDRFMRKLLANDESVSVFQQQFKDMLYLIVLGGSDGPLATEIKQEYSLLPLPFNDRTLTEERSLMAGPGNEVFRSLSAALKDELSVLKDMLDLVERGSQIDYQEMLDLLTRLPKTLSIVGLHSAAKSLQDCQPAVASWTENKGVERQEQLLALADAILYVESKVLGLERPRASQDLQVTETDEAATMASSQLFEARIVVIGESQSGLAMIKRAITAFTESDWDPVHLANIDITLDGIRGGLLFIDETRASAAVAACQRYINEKLLKCTNPPAQEELETLADALTGMDFYLQGLSGGKYNGVDVLKMAESALRDLGFPC